jgi:hypothetical protein
MVSYSHPIGGRKAGIAPRRVRNAWPEDVAFSLDPDSHPVQKAEGRTRGPALRDNLQRLSPRDY